MTRYEELAKLAAKDSKAHFEERAACAYCARAAASYVVDYLQAPHDAVCFTVLDADLRATSETSVTPELRLAPDSIWYFCLQIRFNSKDSPHFGIVNLTIGVSPTATGHVLKFERDFAVSPNEPASFLPFAEHVADSTANDYNRPRKARRNHIGFVPVA